jgi:hypothetical protein
MFTRGTYRQRSPFNSRTINIDKRDNEVWTWHYYWRLKGGILGTVGHTIVVNHNILLTSHSPFTIHYWIMFRLIQDVSTLIFSWKDNQPAIDPRSYIHKQIDCSNKTYWTYCVATLCNFSVLSQWLPFKKMNRESSVDKVTGYGLEGGNCIPDGSRDCLSATTSSPSGTQSDSYTNSSCCGKGSRSKAQTEYSLWSNQKLAMKCTYLQYPSPASKNALCFRLPKAAIASLFRV